MSNIPKCSGCGAPLTAKSQGRVCWRCLGQGLLAEEPGQTVLSEGPGCLIGRYKLLQQIGEGGCGTVFLAEQEVPMRRRVALKIIKLGMDTKAVIARFEAERQALALMDHPNIAKVLDAGATDSGRPYFVMELVRGIKITDYCDQNHLTTRQRLELFIPVCQAIQHAHQKGIIHRDIKPSNILVTLNDGVPVPKVIDFGIAKATVGKLTDHTVFTAVEQFLGTPAYMSPEQAELTSLDIDTRSDIYSLGILLYELLAGSTPFTTVELLSQGIEAMRKMIREQEPARPSTRLSAMTSAESTTAAQRRATDPVRLAGQLQGDLDWIVLKCLEKDRTRRYETANGLATDLRRHLNDEPVVACPPSTAYQLQKAYRRHRGLVFAAGWVLVILLVATVASSWMAIRARTAEKAGQERLAVAQAVSKFMTGVFRSPNPRSNRRTITVAETLDQAVTNLDRDLSAQPAVRAELQATLAETYHSLGLYREAIQLQEKVREYYLNSPPFHATNTLLAMHNLANYYFPAGRLEDMLKSREEALVLSRKVLGPEHPETLKAMQELARSHAAAGHREEALKLYEKALGLSRKVLGPEHPDTIKAMGRLGGTLPPDRRVEALKLQEEALSLSRKILGGEHPGTISAMLNLAGGYVFAGRMDEAAKLREEVLAVRGKVLGLEHPDTIAAMGILAGSYEAGRPAEALKLRAEALTLSRKILGSGNPVTLKAMEDLSRSYRAAGLRDKLVELSEEVLKSRRKALGAEHTDTIGAMRDLANYYGEAGRREEALKLGEEALSLCRKVDGPGHPNTLFAMENLARYHDYAGRQAEALKLREEVLKSSVQAFGAESPETLAAKRLLAWSYAIGGRSTEALKLSEEVLPLYRKLLGPEHRDTLAAMNTLAAAYQTVGRPAEALKLREELWAIESKLVGPEDPNSMSFRANLAQSYADTGRGEDALKLWEEVVQLRLKVSGPENPATLTAMIGLSTSYRRAGRLKEALQLREKVLPLFRKVSGLEHPDTLVAMGNLANSYAEAGRQEEALKLRAEVLSLFRKVNGPEHPNTLGAMNSLAWLLATSLDANIRNGTNAVRLAQEAVTGTHRAKVGYLDTLAAAYAEAQQFDKAAAAEREAIALATSAAERQECGAHLMLFQDHKAYHEGGGH